MKFATHQLECGLWLDGNQKISGWEPVANAFSLVEIKDCPLRTPTCERACYVHGLAKNAPEVHARYEENSRLIRDAIDQYQLLANGWYQDLGDYIRANCAEVGFRWHVSGDIFDAAYAWWIYHAVSWSRPVRNWIYTRSFHLLDPLVELDNLRLNLSADRDNYWLAKRTWDRIKDAPSRPQICYLAVGDGEVPSDLPPGSVVFPDYSLRERAVSPASGRTGSQWYQSLAPAARAGVCPVDFHGVREDRRCGPCRKCL